MKDINTQFLQSSARHMLRIIGHPAIYLPIAGTYAPFALVPLHQKLGLLWEGDQFHSAPPSYTVGLIHNW